MRGGTAEEDGQSLGGTAEEDGQALGEAAEEHGQALGGNMSLFIKTSCPPPPCLLTSLPPYIPAIVIIQILPAVNIYFFSRGL